MNAKWIAVAVFVSIALATWAAVGQGVPVAIGESVNSTADEHVNGILSYALAWQDTGLGYITNVPAHFAYFNDLFHVLMGGQNVYGVFPRGSSWIWIWLILWTPFWAMVIFGVVMLFIGIIQRVFD